MGKQKPCSCQGGDLFAYIPPELRPPRPSKASGLRKVVCPVCGMVYWTNRDQDICFACEGKGPQDHSHSKG